MTKKIPEINNQKKKQKKKSNAGRPSLYKSEYCELASRSCMLGSTNEQLAKLFGVALSTIKKWMKEIPEFSASIKKGRLEADENVAISLYKRATGYSHPDTKAQWVETDVIREGVAVRIGHWEYANLTKHYPPDTGAAFIWLKNRRPDLWRDKQPENNEDIEPTTPVSVQFIVKECKGDNKTDS
jgi:hypothetical protein